MEKTTMQYCSSSLVVVPSFRWRADCRRAARCGRLLQTPGYQLLQSTDFHVHKLPY